MAAWTHPHIQIKISFAFRTPLMVLIEWSYKFDITESCTNPLTLSHINVLVRYYLSILEFKPALLTHSFPIFTGMGTPFYFPSYYFIPVTSPCKSLVIFQSNSSFSVVFLNLISARLRTIYGIFARS